MSTAGHLPERQTVTTADGRRISYRETGAGPVLVLLHGIGSSSDSWAAQFDHFAATHRVVAWDAPGYGDSDDPAPTSPQAADYAAALAACLDALSIRACHLVGHSLGGLMAAAFARSSADRLAALVLADCTAGHGRQPAAAREERLQARLEDLQRLGPGGMAKHRAPRLVSAAAPACIVERVAAVMSYIRPEGYARAARMLANADIFADLAAVPRFPRTLVVCGRDDQITPPSLNERVADAIPDSAFQLIDAAGHLPYLEQPAAFNGIVDDFLKETP